MEYPTIDKKSLNIIVIGDNSNVTKSNTIAIGDDIVLKDEENKTHNCIIINNDAFQVIISPKLFGNDNPIYKRILETL